MGNDYALYFDSTAVSPAGRDVTADYSWQYSATEYWAVLGTRKAELPYYGIDDYVVASSRQARRGGKEMMNYGK